MARYMLTHAAIYLTAAAFIAAPATPLRVATPAAHVLPWHQFSAMSEDAVNAGPFACEGDQREGIVAFLVHGDERYAYFALVGEGGGQWLVGLIGEKGPEWIWLGHADNDTMVIDRSEPFDEKIHGTDPCHILAAPKV